MDIHITLGDLFMKNRKQLNLLKVKHALAFIKATGGLAVIYISLRVLARLLVGKRRRDNIIRELHLGNFSARATHFLCNRSFMRSLKTPHAL